jgi:hypothetical protein
MKSCRRGLAVIITVQLVILALWSSLGAYLVLAVGTMNPRNLSTEERAQNRFEGTSYAAGAVASFLGAAGVLWWGFRRRPSSQEGAGPLGQG